MNSSKLFFIFLALLFSAATLAQRDTILLDQGWDFAIDKRAEGLREGWWRKALPGGRAVALPHTWNVEDENQEHYGWGWYRRKLEVPAGWNGKRVELHFGAVNHTALVFLDGKQVARHVGDGFNAFPVDLTGKLRRGGGHVITVAVNNDHGRNKVPFGSSFDWPNDGGIIRPVMLIISGRPAATYLHATPVLHAADSTGTLALAVGLPGAGREAVELEVTITGDNRPARDTVLQALVRPQWQGEEARATLELGRVRPWHFDSPELYRVEVRVMVHGQETDRIADAVGFRNVTINQGRLYLNGEPVRQMGVEWTAGSNPDLGFAEPDSHIVHMGRLMKEVNTVLSRQHFPQAEVFYDFCDRNGILLQQEIPMWGPETPANDTIRRIAMRQLEEMVHNLRNHPSIFAWGVGNELRGRDADMQGLIKDLIDRAHELDTTRFATYVSNTLTWSFHNDPKHVPDAGGYGDLLMMNEYGGSWWTLPEAAVPAYLDSVHDTYPDRPFFISEFGVCEPNFAGGEERRTRDLVRHMAYYESKPYINGAIYFDLTDYRTHYPGTSDNGRYRRRIHGVYDMYGAPKPSMRVLREESSPVEVQQMRRWEPGKLNLLIFGSIGLPQHAVRGYTLFLSATEDHRAGRAYPLPEISPGQQLDFEVDDLFGGKGVVTIVRPTGHVVTQKVF